RRGLAWPPGEGQGKAPGPTLMLHNAFAAGLLQAAANLDRLFAAGERPDHGAVVDALGPEIGTADGVRLAAEHASELRRDAAIGVLGFGLAPLRRHLHQIAAAGRGRRRRGARRRWRREVGLRD